MVTASTTDVPLVVDTEPVAGLLGAIVRGVDLAASIDHAGVEAIESALARFKVLFFRDQHLDPVSHVAFARRLGDVTRAHPTVPSLPGHEHVFELDAAAGRAGQRVAHRRHVRAAPAAGVDPQRRGHPTRGRRHHLGRHRGRLP